MSHEAREYGERLANVFLGDSKITVTQTKFPGIIASCNVYKKEIYFDFGKIFPDTPEIEDDDGFEEIEKSLKNPLSSAMTYKGLLFHEIYHLKHTVKGRKLKSINQELRKLLGELEDGRIETIGVIEYEKLADFFIYAVNNVLLKNYGKLTLNMYDEVISLYILTYGRKIFLNNYSLIAKLRELVIKFYGQETAEKIEDCVDRHCVETNSYKRVEIAKELFDFFNSKNINPKKFNHSWILDTRREDKKRLTKEEKELNQILKNQLQNALIKIRQEIIDKTNSIPKNNQGTKSKFNGKKIEDINKLRKDRDELRQKAYDLSNDSSKTKSIEEKRKEYDLINKELEKKFEQERELNRKDYFPTQSEMKMSKDVQDAIQSLEADNELLVDKNSKDLSSTMKEIGIDIGFSDGTLAITSEMQNEAESLNDSIKRMNNELKKGYKFGFTTGRVNVRKFVNRKRLSETKVFNKYVFDRLKETKILVNLFIDASGSMNNSTYNSSKRCFDLALESAWVINEAMNMDENKIMCYLFSDNFTKFKGYEDKFTEPGFIGGNTNPKHAIIDAIPIIEKYKKKHNFRNVVDIIITDGCFASFEGDDEIRKLGELGHETILINVSHEDENKHDAKHLIIVNSFSDLTRELSVIFKRIKKNLIRNVKARC